MKPALRGSLARGAYAALLTIAAPAYVLRLLWRGRAEPLYRSAIAERFGHYSIPRSEGWVWIHAVSLGETRAAAALVEALRVLRPGMRLLLTHGTATGRAAGAALLREGDSQAWLPYDAAPVVRRFFRQFRPVVGVLMETEVWPSLLRAASEAGVPMVLANARLSAKSQRSGDRFGALLRPAAESLALVLAQSDADAERLRAAGARTVIVAGNLKFDLTPDPAQLDLGRRWGERVGRPVVIAAVTREGEEAALLAVWSARPGPRPLLLVVPRHPQRFDEVAALIDGAGFVCTRRSRWGDDPDAEALGADVWLGDSIGEMAIYYAIARIALLGGSFEPFGGQNLIEAAACGCGIVMGPHTWNFAEAAELALAADAARRVADMGEAIDKAVSLLASGEDRRMAAAAEAFATRHRGAAVRMARSIVDLDEGAA